MDPFDAPPIWDFTTGKTETVIGYLSKVWPLQSPSSSASPAGLARATSRIKPWISHITSQLNTPAVVLGAVVVGTVAVAASWAWSNVRDVQHSQISRFEAENAKLFADIDRLNRDNENLLEGNQRAKKLNQEVQELLRMMASGEANPEIMNSELRVLLHNLLDLCEVQLAKLQARNEELATQNRILREETLCKICFDYPTGASFVPCGHGTCTKCSPKFKEHNCPFCRTLVTSVIPRY